VIIEVDRAIENLFKSGKIFNMPSRRDSIPMGAVPGRGFPEFGKLDCRAVECLLPAADILKAKAWALVGLRDTIRSAISVMHDRSLPQTCKISMQLNVTSHLVQARPNR
jgi:hypothetical protein